MTEKLKAILGCVGGRHQTCSADATHLVFYGGRFMYSAMCERHMVAALARDPNVRAVNPIAYEPGALRIEKFTV